LPGAAHPSAIAKAGDANTTRSERTLGFHIIATLP
jgi:hypothetical protein